MFPLFLFFLGSIPYACKVSSILALRSGDLEGVTFLVVQIGEDGVEGIDGVKLILLLLLGVFFFFFEVPVGEYVDAEGRAQRYSPRLSFYEGKYAGINSFLWSLNGDTSLYCCSHPASLAPELAFE
jgi:hypothetical protein